LEGNELKRTRSVMIAFVFLFGVNIPGAIAQTDGSGMVSVDLKFTLAKPLSQEFDGDHGNVIVPLVLDFKEGGKPLRANGLANVVLLKNRETWKIPAFTFTQQSF
jgi:hypothetical protein